MAYVGLLVNVLEIISGKRSGLKCAWCCGFTMEGISSSSTARGSMYLLLKINFHFFLVIKCYAVLKPDKMI